MIKGATDQFVNRELFDNTKHFLQTALPIVISKITNYNDKKNFSERKKDNKRYNKLEPITKPIFSRLVETHMAEIQQLPEFQNCISIMQNDETVSKHFLELVGKPKMRSSINARNCLGHMLIKTAGVYYQKKKFDYDLFKKMYHDLEEFFYTDYIPFIILVPLHNFEMERTAINISSEICVRKITDNEKNWILNDLENLRWYREDVHLLKYMIDYKFKEKKSLERLLRKKVMTNILSIQ